MNIVIIIAAVLISLAIGIPIGMAYRKKVAESKINGAETEAKRLIDSAKKEAENLKKEEIIKAKEEIMASRKELDQEIKERRGEIQKQEAQKQELEKLYDQEMVQLQKIAALSKEEAKQKLLTEMEKELTAEKAALIREQEQKAKEEVTKNAKEMLCYAVQKCAADHSQETTVSIVALPNDEMKGRIIR